VGLIAVSVLFVWKEIDFRISIFRETKQTVCRVCSAVAILWIAFIGIAMPFVMLIF
jgi:hypothetical protein